MCLQPFCLSEMDDRSSDSLESARGEFLDGDDLYEIQHRQATTKARNAGGRQDMVRPRCVITGSLSGIVSDKNRAGILNGDRKSTRLNSSHLGISYAVFCL